MSAGIGIWKDTLVGQARAELRRIAAAAVAPIPTAPDDDPVCLLVRQLFFANPSQTRKRLLFVSAGPETNVHGICERIGKMLSDISGGSVALMHSSPNATFGEKRSRGAHDRNQLLDGVQLAERVWRIPPSLFSELRSNAVQLKSELPFDYVLFSGAVHDSATPLFCCASDGAVLVLTANQTRRESAVRAIEVLRQCRIEVLGTVLDDRKFPIPESIYRRL